MALPETGVVRMGGGVRQEGEVLVATKAGLLRTARGGKLWVEARQRRYTPSPEDVVIGRIVDKHAGGLPGGFRPRVPTPTTHFPM